MHPIKIRKHNTAFTYWTQKLNCSMKNGQRSAPQVPSMELLWRVAWVHHSSYTHEGLLLPLIVAAQGTTKGVTTRNGANVCYRLGRSVSHSQQIRGQTTLDVFWAARAANKGSGHKHFGKPQSPPTCDTHRKVILEVETTGLGGTVRVTNVNYFCLYTVMVSLMNTTILGSFRSSANYK